MSASFPKFAILPAAILLDTRIGASELRVYAALSLHAAKSRSCCVTHARIVEICGFSEKSIKYVSVCIRKLVEFGYVTVKPQGFKRPNIYLLSDVAITKNNKNLRTVTDRRVSNDEYSQRVTDISYQNLGFQSRTDYDDYQNSTGIYADAEQHRLAVEREQNSYSVRQMRRMDEVSAVQSELEAQGFEGSYEELVIAAHDIVDARNKESKKTKTTATTYVYEPEVFDQFDNELV